MGIKKKKDGPLPNAKAEWQILARRGDMSGAVRSYLYDMRQVGVQVPVRDAYKKIRNYVGGF